MPPPRSQPRRASDPPPGRYETFFRPASESPTPPDPPPPPPAQPAPSSTADADDLSPPTVLALERLFAATPTRLLKQANRQHRRECETLLKCVGAKITLGKWWVRRQRDEKREKRKEAASAAAAAASTFRQSSSSASSSSSAVVRPPASTSSQLPSDPARTEEDAVRPSQLGPFSQLVSPDKAFYGSAVAFYPTCAGQNPAAVPFPLSPSLTAPVASASRPQPTSRSSRALAFVPMARTPRADEEPSSTVEESVALPARKLVIGTWTRHNEFDPSELQHVYHILLPAIAVSSLFLFHSLASASSVLLFVRDLSSQPPLDFKLSFVTTRPPTTLPTTDFTPTDAATTSTLWALELGGTVQVLDALHAIDTAAAGIRGRNSSGATLLSRTWLGPWDASRLSPAELAASLRNPVESPEGGSEAEGAGPVLAFRHPSHPREPIWVRPLLRPSAAGFVRPGKESATARDEAG
ncbi:hypothetical protein JCM21900_004346 [Sporobolomyces salmonicolor]